MSQILQVARYTLGGILSVLLIDTAGAVLSRRLRFNYGYLSIFSFSVYILAGYLISGVAGVYMALIAGLVIGFIDATAGWRLAQYFKAHITLNKEELKELTTSANLKVMLFIGPLFVYFGHLLA